MAFNETTENLSAEEACIESITERRNGEGRGENCTANCVYLYIDAIYLHSNIREDDNRRLRDAARFALVVP